MSNTWFYNILLSPQITISNESINKILSLAKSVGYSTMNPITGMISIMSTDGMEEFKFDQVPEAINFLSSDGGLLSLWDDDVDIGLWIDRSNTMMDLHNPSNLREISIIIAHHHFRDPTTRLKVANNVQKLFIDLCKILEPIYGYSVDEPTMEIFADRLYGQGSIWSYGKPSVLFWLNYFSHRQVSQNEIDIFKSLGGIIAELSSGIIVSFFDYPWDVDINMLQSVNDRWRRLSPEHG